MSQQPSNPEAPREKLLRRFDEIILSIVSDKKFLYLREVKRKRILTTLFKSRISPGKKQGCERRLREVDVQVSAGEAELAHHVRELNKVKRDLMR